MSNGTLFVMPRLPMHIQAVIQSYGVFSCVQALNGSKICPFASVKHCTFMFPRLLLHMLTSQQPAWRDKVSVCMSAVVDGWLTLRLGPMKYYSVEVALVQWQLKGLNVHCRHCQKL